MNSLFRACSSAILSSSRQIPQTHSLTKLPLPICKLTFTRSRFNAVKLVLRLRGLNVRCYSSAKKSVGKTRAVKPRVMEGKKKESKNEFFVVRKGDLIGVYSTLSDCQAQVGSSICDTPVSVYKGYSMPKKTEEYLLSCGLKDALYSIRAADLKDDLFGPLVSCPFQLPSSTQNEMDVSKKRPFEAIGAETMKTGKPDQFSTSVLQYNLGLSTSISLDPMSRDAKQLCILEFDGASKGNPGRSGAGAVLRADDGSVICRVREGLGTTTNNVAEYRAMILGLRYALQKGFENIRVMGDSKLVCMQIQEQWKVRDQNISILYKEAKKLKDKFLFFEISHVLRGSNKDADAQANLGATLADGEIQEDFA